MSDAGPAIRFPPPLMFVSGLLIGWALDHYLLPWRLVADVRLPWAWALAAAFALVATALLVAALGGFRRRGTDPRPWKDDSALVVEGIYLHTRNPMYLGMALLHVAVALGLNSFWALLWLGPVLFVVQHQVIAREEAYLAGKFGEAYRDYCQRVHRWL